MNRRAEHGQHDVERMQQDRHDDTDNHEPERPAELVGNHGKDDRGHADRHQPRVREDVSHGYS